jgi:hypothetical protein
VKEIVFDIYSRGASMRKAVSGIILFFSLLPGFLFCAEKEVDLGFLLQKGELIYPDLKKKFYELQHARAREDEVFARRLPDLDVNIFFNYIPWVYTEKVNGASSESLRIDASDWSPFIAPTASLTIPIYTFGKLKHGAEAAKYNVEVKKAELEESKADVRYKVKQLFWGFLLVDSLRKYVLDDTLSRYDKILKEREEDFIQGKVTRASLEDSRITYYDLKRNEASAEQGYEQALTWLRRIAGVSKDDKLVLKTKRLQPLEPELKPFDYYLAMAKKYNPGIKKAQYGYLARKAWYDYQQSDLLPDIFFHARGSFVYYSFEDREVDPEIREDTILPDQEWTVYCAFGIRWNLNFWRKSSKSDQNRYSFMGDLEQIKMGYEFQESQLNAAKRWFLLSLNAYESGTGDINEAERGLVVLFRRKKDYYEAAFNFNMAIARFEKELGMDIISYEKGIGGGAEYAEF